MGTCQLCGKPNGPNGESICYDCGMKDRATTERKFAELLGDSTQVLFVTVPDKKKP